MRLAVFVCFLFISSLLAQFTVAGTLYKWVDENGKMHATTEAYKVPEKFREALEPIYSVVDEATSVTTTDKETSKSVRKKEPKKNLTYDWKYNSNGYKYALKESQETGTPIFFYFYTDWCPYCKKFDGEVLTSSYVNSCLSKLIKVRINPEKGKDERAIADKFRVRSYPYIFIKENGQTRPSRITSHFSQKTIVQGCKDALN